MESDIIKSLLSLGEAGEDAALVTIIRTLGSTPRNAGAKMLVLPDGSVYGSIGGGCGEAEIKREALDMLLNSKISKKFRLELTNDVAAGDGMVCGGVLDVFIDFIGHEDHISRQVFSNYLDSLQKKEDPLLVTVTDVDVTGREILGRKMTFLPDSIEVGDLVIPEITEQVRKLIKLVRTEREIKLLTLSAGEIKNIELLFEPAYQSPHLLILGGGHISKPLVKMASILGYNTTVVDDRPVFANTIRFPEADQVVCQDFDNFMKNMKISPDTFVVIITRGHKHDLECLREVVVKPAAYIGMIGSRKKVKAVLMQLESEGISAEKLKGVYSPIGLDIGSETPEEIALSILAEIVSVWRCGNTRSLPEKKQ
jgi:xanthine dehydrogenase accessory factor